MMQTEILMPAHESPSAAAYQVEDAAEQIVDTIRRLTVDRADAIEYVMAQLRLAQRAARLLASIDLPPP